MDEGVEGSRRVFGFGGLNADGEFVAHLGEARFEHGIDIAGVRHPFAGVAENGAVAVEIGRDFVITFLSEFLRQDHRDVAGFSDFLFPVFRVGLEDLVGVNVVSDGDVLGHDAGDGARGQAARRLALDGKADASLSQRGSVLSEEVAEGFDKFGLGGGHGGDADVESDLLGNFRFHIANCRLRFGVSVWIFQEPRSWSMRWEIWRARLSALDDSSR
jgi:hypothetical protein